MENEKQARIDSEEPLEQADPEDETLTVAQLDELSGGLLRRFLSFDNDLVMCPWPTIQKDLLENN